MSSQAKQIFPASFEDQEKNTEDITGTKTN